MGNTMRASRALIAALGISLLAFAAYDAARRGLADWQSMRARNEVRRWAEKATAPPLKSWEQAVDSLRGAVKLTPGNPNLYESLGVAYEVGSRSFDQAGRPVLAELGLVNFRQAASLRPTSPFSWANVALMKDRLWQRDAELGRALASAMHFGPWEPNVQWVVSSLGLAHWDRIGPELKAEVRENWRRMAYRHADWLASLAVAHGRERLLCEDDIDALKKPLECKGL